MLTRSSAGILALAAALAVCFTPAAAASGAGSDRPSPVVIHAAGRAFISDGAGREMLLRGINSTALIEYPENFQQTIPLGRADFSQMAALGFNFLRLPINWSLLEPQPDRFSQAYLSTIDRIVGWAGSEGLSVLIDFHQDRYHRNLRPPDEADGAPDWATDTDEQPCTFGEFFTSPCSVAAYDHFWNNDVMAGKPLQTHYLEAMVKVSRYLRHHKGLLGIEIMNEPTQGSVPPPQFEREQLWPFNNRMIRGLRKSGEKHPIWFGPNIFRDVFDRDPGKPESFSTDRNLVYAPHIYTGTFNTGGPDELRASVELAATEAKAYGAALVDAEWGGGSGGKSEALHALKHELHNEFRTGGAFWMWKQKSGFYNWHTVNEDGSLRDDSLRAQMLSQPHADRVPGQIVSTSFGDGELTTVSGGRGGLARLWSGTVVYRGGETLIDRPLIRAFVDGKRVRAALKAKAFGTTEVRLRGFRVFVRVPAGRHEIKLLPGTPEWVKGRWVGGRWAKGRRTGSGRVKGRRIEGYRVPGFWRNARGQAASAGWQLSSHNT